MYSYLPVKQDLRRLQNRCPVNRNRFLYISENSAISVNKGGSNKRFFFFFFFFFFFLEFSKLVVVIFLLVSESTHFNADFFFFQREV